jgi:hypothetical protein
MTAIPRNAFRPSVNELDDRTLPSAGLSLHGHVVHPLAHFLAIGHQLSPAAAHRVVNHHRHPSTAGTIHHPGRPHLPTGGPRPVVAVPVVKGPDFLPGGFGFGFVPGVDFGSVDSGFGGGGLVDSGFGGGGFGGGDCGCGDLGSVGGGGDFGGDGGGF